MSKHTAPFTLISWVQLPLIRIKEAQAAFNKEIAHHCKKINKDEDRLITDLIPK